MYRHNKLQTHNAAPCRRGQAYEVTIGIHFLNAQSNNTVYLLRKHENEVKLQRHAWQC